MSTASDSRDNTSLLDHGSHCRGGAFREGLLFLVCLDEPPNFGNKFRVAAAEALQVAAALIRGAAQNGIEHLAQAVFGLRS
ncbi:MAG: hypothetical protein IPK72_21345 [Candidatus Eisenbacteria bacterium]|nr:hypothetical protein [Candidatus Eisenbacteria bacterium]